MLHHFAALALAASYSYPGFDDLARYKNASLFLVGAFQIETFSSASAAGPDGANVHGHGLPAPEALCHCSCDALANMAYCRDTAKTTVGVATFYWDAFDDRWAGRSLRYFADGTAGAEAGRRRTSFLSRSVLPDGPGGPMLFDVAYAEDQTADASARSAEVVRGSTTSADCAAAPLCDKQCAGVPQYVAWKARCAKGTQYGEHASGARG